MDMRISSSGVISSGDYDDIYVGGSCRAEGFIRCKSFSCSGSFSGKADIECENEFSASGSFSNKGTVKAGYFHCSGSASNSADITADKIKCSGSFAVQGNVKARELKISGSLRAAKDIEAEIAKFGGSVHCDGMINAEELYIDISSSDSKAASIGGSKVEIKSNPSNLLFNRLFFKKHGSFTTESIEADEIDIEYTNAKTVCGRCVNIGKGCKIDLVQYSDKIEIAPDAKVGKFEKI